VKEFLASHLVEVLLGLGLLSAALYFLYPRRKVKKPSRTIPWVEEKVYTPPSKKNGPKLASIPIVEVVKANGTATSLQDLLIEQGLATDNDEILTMVIEKRIRVGKEVISRKWVFKDPGPVIVYVDSYPAIYVKVL